jgi:hypothetical protein
VSHSAAQTRVRRQASQGMVPVRLRVASPADEGFRSVFIYLSVCASGMLFSASVRREQVSKSASQQVSRGLRPVAPCPYCSRLQHEFNLLSVLALNYTSAPGG